MEHSTAHKPLKLLCGERFLALMPPPVAQGVGRDDVRPTFSSVASSNNVLGGGLKVTHARWLQSESPGEGAASLSHIGRSQ
jgi:hypothetical protein